MDVKTFEVRDAATFIPVIAIRFENGRNEDEAYLMRRAGYATCQAYVLLAPLAGGKLTYDAYTHSGGSRTLRDAHIYIERYWYELFNGQVIDVEFLSGESHTPKASERKQWPL